MRRFICASNCYNQNRVGLRQYLEQLQKQTKLKSDSCKVADSLHQALILIIQKEPA